LTQTLQEEPQTRKAGLRFAVERYAPHKAISNGKWQYSNGFPFAICSLPFEIAL
jgi:hypothetical protein